MIDKVEKVNNQWWVRKSTEHRAIFHCEISHLLVYQRYFELYYLPSGWSRHDNLSCWRSWLFEKYCQFDAVRNPQFLKNSSNNSIQYITVVNFQIDEKQYLFNVFSIREFENLKIKISILRGMLDLLFTRKF